MRLDRFLTLHALGPLVKVAKSREGIRIPILMYHSISDDFELGVPYYYNVQTSPARFREQMVCLREQGYAVIDLPEALRRLQTGAPAGNRCVALTFDDGYQDFMTHGWPILTEFGYTATMFLPTAFIGSSRKSFKERGCLTWAEVRELHSAGVSFGSHTVNHPQARLLPFEQLEVEIRESRLEIEDRLGSPVSCFSYPYAFPEQHKGFVTALRKVLGRLDIIWA